MNEKSELVTVYKSNGKPMNVNKDMLPFLEKLNLSKNKPKQVK